MHDTYTEHTRTHLKDLVEASAGNEYKCPNFSECEQINNFRWESHIVYVDTRYKYCKF